MLLSMLAIVALPQVIGTGQTNGTPTGLQASTRDARPWVEVFGGE